MVKRFSIKFYHKIAQLSLLAMLFTYAAQPQQSSKGYTPIHSNSYIQDKNFYLLTLLEAIPGVKKLINNDVRIQAVTQKRIESVKNAAECKTDVACIVGNFRWNAQEVEQIGDALKGLLQKNTSLKSITQHLRSSGYFNLYDTLEDETLFAKAWSDAAAGMNQILETYGSGSKGLYPNIDSASYDVHSLAYGRLVGELSYHTASTLRKTDLFFTPSLQLALDLLEINNRDEAARLEPLVELENKATIAYTKRINWKTYPYSILLVPGAGNDLPNVSLSAWGKIRVKLAVEQYRKGAAPLIIVSGGYVHPFQTPFCEAVEMKKYLIKKYRIPERAILIEPYARHTTTNIRNATRLIYESEIPVKKKALIVTTQDQCIYIEDNKFAERNIKELHYVPYSGLKRTSFCTLEFIPVKSCLQRSSSDPLDP